MNHQTLTIEPSVMRVTLLSHTENADQLCGEAAALCYQGKDWERSLSRSMASGHTSVTEHASFTFLIEGVSRVLLAQLTRHRLASFSVTSQRYCGISGGMIVPPSMQCPALQEEIQTVIQAVERLYSKATSLGVPKEDARYFSLQGGTTSLMITMNARELNHFFSLRCCRRAQWEIRQLADEMLKLCKLAAPKLFENAGPGCVRGGCPEGKMSCGRPRNQNEWNGEENHEDH